MPIAVLKVVDEMILALPANDALRGKIAELRGRIVALEEENDELRRQLSLTPMNAALEPAAAMLLKALFAVPAGLESRRLATVTGFKEDECAALLDDLRKRGMVFCIRGVFTIRQSGRDFVLARELQ